MKRTLHYISFNSAAMMLLATACSHTSTPTPQEEPPLMAAETRFTPMNEQEQSALEQALAPMLQAENGAELWFHAATEKDDGSFSWCISPAPSESEWVRIGHISHTTLQQLAAERTTVEHGDTLDYWMRLELRCNGYELPISLCPAEEFGVYIGDCSSVRARDFHNTLWNALDKKYNIQKRLDKAVQE